MINLRNRNKILIIPKSFGVSVASYSFILILVSDQINLADGVRISGTKGNKQLSKAAVTTEHKWRLESLDAHNFLRSLHGSPPLVLNKTLSEISQYYANHLLQTYLKTLSNQNGDSTFFQHNPEVGQANIGENLYYSIMKAVLDPIPASYAVLLWYEEFRDYDFTLASRKSTSDPNAKIGTRVYSMNLYGFVAMAHDFALKTAIHLIFIGHLTQLLWKGTTQMGTAYASRKLPNNQTAVFVVANYFRQGNVVLRGNEKKLYLENVIPPTITEAEINAVIVSWQVKSWWKDQELRVYTPTSWQNVVLKAHNFYREKHGAQPLRLNLDLCTVNQLWTNYLLEKGLQSFNHFGGVLNKIQPNFLARLTNFGESSMYFLLEHEQVSVETVVKMWYTQGYNYDFNKLSRNSKTKTDKFERIIWNSTTEFCMSYSSKRVDSGEYLVYVSALYYPSIIYQEADRIRNIFPAIHGLNDNQNKNFSAGNLHNAHKIDEINKTTSSSSAVTTKISIAFLVMILTINSFSNVFFSKILYCYVIT